MVSKVPFYKIKCPHCGKVGYYGDLNVVGRGCLYCGGIIPVRGDYEVAVVECKPLSGYEVASRLKGVGRI